MNLVSTSPARNLPGLQLAVGAPALHHRLADALGTCGKSRKIPKAYSAASSIKHPKAGSTVCLSCERESSARSKREALHFVSGRRDAVSGAGPDLLTDLSPDSCKCTHGKPN